MAHRTRYEKGDTITLVLFAFPAVALLVWSLFSSHNPARLLLSCYFLAATPFYVLSGFYPPFGSRWFWKAMLSIAALAAVGVYIQIQITEWFRYIEMTLPTRMAFGYTATFALLEGWAALRIVDATEPKNGASDGSHQT